MKVNYHFERLSKHILALSANNSSFALALPEWEVTGVTLAEAKCPCGVNILQNCHLHNTITGKDTIVGSTCVKRFLGITSFEGIDLTKLFEGLTKLAKEPTSCPTKEVITFASVKNFIYPNETEFLLKIVGKRKLTEKQDSWRNKIVYRILNKVEVILPTE